MFQEVRSRTTRQSKSSHHAELQPCRSQIRETLDANRQRETKWTTDGELGLLMELWGRMARREPRTFDFAFRSHETSETVDLNFTKEAVKWKLKQLAQKGPEGGAPTRSRHTRLQTKWPSCIPCTSSSSTGAAARRCASVQTTHLHAFLTISTSPDAQIARSDEYGTFTWEEPSTPTPYDESNGLLPNPIARSSEPNHRPQ